MQKSEAAYFVQYVVFPVDIFLLHKGISKVSLTGQSKDTKVMLPILFREYATYI